MSAQHTPEPWVAELGADGAFSIEADKRGITSGLLVLASRNQHPLLADQMHANARLIAAAPDLLELMVVIAMYTDSPHGNPRKSMGFIRETALFAIAKATGEQA